MEAESTEQLEELLNSQKFNMFNLFYWDRIVCDEVHEIESMLKGNILHKYISFNKETIHLMENYYTKTYNLYTNYDFIEYDKQYNFFDIYNI